MILIVVLSLTIFTACDKKDNQPNDNDNNQTENNDNNQGQEKNKEDEYGIIVEDEQVAYTDDSGAELVLKKKPEKTVILFSSFIDIWVKNGGTLIGMTEDELTHDVPGLENVQGVGRTGGLSLEKIISLEPELVILSMGTTEQREMIPALKENNIEVLALEYIGKDDYYRIASLFSKINDREDLYEENVVKVKNRVNEIIDKAPHEDKKVFIMFASSKAISARGSDSTLGEMLKDLNAVNIADGASDVLNDKNFSMEKIMEEDPEFIFVQTRGSDMDAVNERIQKDVESNPAWASLSAVKNDKYLLMPKDLYLYKANDRYGEAYEELAKILYPEVFH